MLLLFDAFEELHHIWMMLSPFCQSTLLSQSIGFVKWKDVMLLCSGLPWNLWGNPQSCGALLPPMPPRATRLTPLVPTQLSSAQLPSLAHLRLQQSPPTSKTPSFAVPELDHPPKSFSLSLGTEPPYTLAQYPFFYPNRVWTGAASPNSIARPIRPKSKSKTQTRPGS